MKKKNWSCKIKNVEWLISNKDFNENEHDEAVLEKKGMIVFLTWTQVSWCCNRVKYLPWTNWKFGY